MNEGQTRHSTRVKKPSKFKIMLVNRDLIRKTTTAPSQNQKAMKTRYPIPYLGYHTQST